MINIFLPDQIRSYYLFTKRIVAITITKNKILASICKIHGNKRVIEQLIEQYIDQSPEMSLEYRIIEALKSLKPRLGLYNTLIGVYQSSNIIFKDITLPFSELDKVKAILPFEIEPLLPFTIDSAVIDSVITDQNKETGQSNVLVLASTKQLLEDYINLFESANLTLDKITVSSLEIYNFFSEIPEYKKIQGSIALINLGESETDILIFDNHKLKFIRTINRGINSQNLTQIFQAIDFTISSYIKSEASSNITAVLCGAEIDTILNISNLAKDNLSMNIHIMDIKSIMYNDHISSKATSISNTFLPSLAASLLLPNTFNFNLQQIKSNQKEVGLINKQIITGIILTILPLLSLSVFGFFHVKNLKTSISKEEELAISNLKKHFKLPARINKLAEANKAARTELNKQETANHNLSEENRYALLRYLSQITKCLNLKETRLDISRLDIIPSTDINTENIVKLYGSVPDYEYLNKLQAQLECPEFKPIGKLHELNFKTNPIELIIKE